jgi:hypothetical protein
MLQQAFAGSIEPVYRGVTIFRVRRTAARLLVCVAKAAGRRCRSGTGLRNGRIVRVSRIQPCIEARGLVSTKVHMSPCTHHIHPRCLNSTVPHLVPPCTLQMSGTGLGPSAATISKWPKRSEEAGLLGGCLKEENLRRQRESTARATEGADPASGFRRS